MNNIRYLINTESKHADKTCEMILKEYKEPKTDAEVYFDKVKTTNEKLTTNIETRFKG